MKYFIERPVCPACASKDVKKIYEKAFMDEEIKNYLIDFYSPQGGVDFKYLQDAQYVLNECNSCGLIFQRFIGNDELMEELYERWIDARKIFENEVLRADLNYYIGYSEEVANIISNLKKAPNELNIFDFGMGWGKWSLMVKAFGCQSYGTELSQTRIDYAENNGIKVIKYEQIKDHQFDFINCEQVFEHIPNPLETLRYLSTGLRKGGVIKISVPNGRKAKYVLSKMNWRAKKWTNDSLNVVAPLEHINCFQQRSLEIMAAQAQLKTVKFKMPFHFSRQASEQRDLRSFAKDSLRPLYRSYLRTSNQSTYLFFQKS